jgi:hypothetical protein
MRGLATVTAALLAVAVLCQAIPGTFAQGSVPDPKPGFDVPTLPSGTVRPGNCGETIDGDCAGATGTAGAWSGDNPAVPKTLEDCVALCVACPATKCTYVSFSVTNRDCRSEIGRAHV